ncbi:hypothetical protein [Halorubrum sp. SD626R]|uniref:hypothetical protein n=1 Tax=Halorubrum sp. SD626R TaxID=1419722 RepID=UPI0013051D4B|nr:hypothetical protein [Halorubrum sp. SD626R]
MTPPGLATLGPTAFAALVWGSLALVAVVFGYVATAYAREALGAVGVDDGGRR